VPNNYNVAGVGQPAFGISQVLDHQQYRGKSLYFSGWLEIDPGAIAVLRLATVDGRGRVTFRELRQFTPTRNPVFRRDVLDIPDRDDIFVLFISVTVEGTSGSAYFDDLTVSPDMPTSWPAYSGMVDDGPNLQARVFVNTSQVLRRIPRTVYGTNLEWVFGGNGIWNPMLDNLDPDIVGLTRALGPTLMRYPSGFFADFYHWKSATGDRKTRPPGRMLHVGSETTSDFGSDEALQFAAATDSQLMLMVNITTGTPEEAAEWVRYVNNGSRYVRYWEIGNEPYVDLGQIDPSIAAETPQSYAEKFRAFALAMKEADPTIRVGAAMDFGYGYTTYHPYPTWTEDVLNAAGTLIDFISVHNGFSPVLNNEREWSVRSIYSTMYAATVEQKITLRALADLIERTMGTKSGIEICVSEWGPFFSDSRENQYLDHTKTLGSAIYVASFFKVLLEEPRVFAANTFKLNDAGLYSGWIGIRDGVAVPKAPYFATQLFTRHFGPDLVQSSTISPTYDSRSNGWVDAVEAVPYFETLASRSEDGSTVYLIAINKHFDRAVDGLISLSDFCPTGPATVRTLNGTGIDANTGTRLVDGPLITWSPQAEAVPNGRMNQGGPDEVGITTSAIPLLENFDYQFPPHSVTAFEIPGTPPNCPEDSVKGILSCRCR
jgi:alpha-N-arabinofuranosidase